ncbi:stringent starvation protein SspA [Gallaecimonas pentaromativorans]|uniref:RNA polymerase-associated protein n=1 Tax=Gallaecimonas pentaromativorans TaxID=584787 RepID=A0A3N1Q1R9_9GAMM|nr:stringent starvation protein SspA [Gallaecimonas pentaromativorans]MED5523596.1 stringent starvation protein SspA [Pseudomonadota bacterium]ROQ30786.1 RNA polymerase-associated protein [Gallaecimonas pentaromativorans]
MALAANKRSVMTLFGGGSDMYSHQVRIVLAEKGVTYDIVEVDLSNPPEDLVELNPYVSVPTLVDREVTLYRADIINEYLDERFPHPPLMPVYPVMRGNARQTMYRIQRDWYVLADRIEKGEKVAEARQELREGLLALAPLFADTPYFLSEEFGLVDCVLAPLLWRLNHLGIELSGRGAKEIRTYMARIFERESFQASLSDAEREYSHGA